MGFRSETPFRIFVGAGEVYIDGVPIGATQSPNQFRINRTYVDIPKFNGVKGPVRHTDYVSEELAQIELSLSEMAFDQLQLVLPGLTSAASAEAPDAASSTLADAVVIGDTEAEVASGTDFEPGMWVMVGTGPDSEHVLIRSVSGSTLTLATPFTKAHASAATVVEQTGSGGMLISSRPGRLGTADYIGVAELRVPGVDGRFAAFRVFDAVSVDNFEIEVSDETNARYPLTLEGRYNENDAALAPWLLELKESAS